MPFTLKREQQQASVGTYRRKYQQHKHIKLFSSKIYYFLAAFFANITCSNWSATIHGEKLILTCDLPYAHVYYKSVFLSLRVQSLTCVFENESLLPHASVS